MVCNLNLSRHNKVDAKDSLKGFSVISGENVNEIVFVNTAIFIVYNYIILFLPNEINKYLNKVNQISILFNDNTECGVRTHDHQLKRLALYQTELIRFDY